MTTERKLALEERAAAMAATSDAHLSRLPREEQEAKLSAFERIVARIRARSSSIRGTGGAAAQTGPFPVHARGR